MSPFLGISLHEQRNILDYAFVAAAVFCLVSNGMFLVIQHHHHGGCQFTKLSTYLLLFVAAGYDGLDKQLMQPKENVEVECILLRWKTQRKSPLVLPKK